METVLIAGGSGMIGRKITHLLQNEGFQSLVLTRNNKKVGTKGFAYWNPSTNEIDENITTADHVINLAGAGIADKRWSSSRKKQLIESRTISTQFLIDSISKHDIQLKTYTNASAVGYYGNRGDELLDESSSKGSDFLSHVCQLWEASVEKAQQIAERVSIMRIGVVLSKEGGALAKMDATVPYGVSSILGSGKQFMPWIHIDDLAHIFLDAIRNTEISGIYNAVSPNPVSQKKFAQSLNHAMNSRALLLPTPSFLLKTILGEMSAVVLNSTNVSAQKLVDSGFEFQFPNLDTALQEIYGD